MADLHSGEQNNEELLNWATRQGIIYEGIRPARFPEGYRGVVATRKLKQGDEVIFVPSSALLTIDSDVAFLKKHAHQIRDCSVNGKLAASLLCSVTQPDHPLRPWALVLPRLEELKSCMPLFWSFPNLPAPPSTMPLLNKQSLKYYGDLNAVKKAFLSTIAEEVGRNIPDLEELYKYSWLLVNSRCFYWDFEYAMPTLRDGERWPENWKKPKARRRTRGRDRDDCMALCPLMDFFNHATQASCAATYDERGYFVTCTRDCEPGEELFVTYGHHSNDYLFVEYGFLLHDNDHDSISIDNSICKRLSHEQKERLEEENFLGTYTLDYSGICFRTECALRILFLPFEQWQRFICGAEDTKSEKLKENELLKTVLREILEPLEKKIQEIEHLPVHRSSEKRYEEYGEQSQYFERAKAMVLQRYKEVVLLVRRNIEQL